MKKVWGIVGLGWLGQQLKNRLVEVDHNVWGTHRSDFNFLLDLPMVPECDVLFLNTPPLLDLSPETFAQKVFRQWPVSREANSASPRIIFTSSTSVYGGQSGTVTELSSRIPVTANAKWLVQVEDLLSQYYQDQLLILRPGGLIGPDRHPIYSMSKRSEVKGGLDPINLVHSKDLVEIILALENQSPIKVLNAVSPFHPLKKEYYTACAIKLALPVPHFEESESELRIVNSQFLSELFFDWQYPLL